MLRPHPWTSLPPLPDSSQKALFLGAAWSKGSQVCRGWLGLEAACVHFPCMHAAPRQVSSHQPSTAHARVLPV